jgi:hypothetical protein
MANTTYTFSVSGDFPNQVVAVDRLTQEIRDSDITIALNSISVINTSCEIEFKDALETAEETTLDGIVAIHDGTPLPSHEEVEAQLADEKRDRSGKLRVHQTSRKLGLRIMWFGCGDDPTNPTSVGGGESLTFQYTTGSEDPLVKYIDFNIVENETWLHEGYITWKDAQMDVLDLAMVPRVTEVTVSSGTNYNLYGGYLVVPAAGNGTIDVVSDITTHSGGLIYMPDNDLGEAPTAFWNADWNTTTKRYENITPAPYGNGRYNMFAVEVQLAHFIRHIPLLADGFIALGSSDTDQMGHGMRLKMTADTNNNVPDHNWSVACIMCLHREKSVG